MLKKNPRKNLYPFYNRKETKGLIDFGSYKIEDRE